MTEIALRRSPGRWIGDGLTRVGARSIGGAGLVPAAVAAGPAAWTPIAGAAIDLDFARGKYWWGGAEKTTGDFTTFALNGSTLDATGLTPSTTVDITLTLPAGTFVPGAMAVAFTNLSLPAAIKTVCVLDNGTTQERVQCSQTTGGLFNCTVFDNNVSQAAPGAGTGTLTKHGFAASYDTNSVMAAVNGAAGAADTSATMPTVTLLRIGKSIAAASNPAGIIGRVAVFTAVKTQLELNALSTAMQTGVFP